MHPLPTTASTILHNNSSPFLSPFSDDETTCSSFNRLVVLVPLCPLTINLDRAPFKIALFADLHFGENAWTDWGPQQDVNSVKVMSSVLDDESPDFVIYLGDVITANNIPIANASLYWDEAISPTRARGIPWASIFGNHDDAPFEWPMAWFSSPGIPPIHCPAPNASSCSGERYCSFGGTRRIELMKKEIENNLLTLSKTGPKDLWPSISNYVLQLSSSDDPESPAEWFQHVSEEINPDSRVPERKVAAQEAELGIMDMLAKRSSVKAVFAGHNHGLDWCCPYKKLWLCYARHTGYGGYGNWRRGARILEINDQPFYIKSWIRMEDGDEHSHIILSP
ncbi:hypothetical protein OIU85_000331 [Salix viminalis]|uniref:Calcineurin-like phosphoesterase domain-containing protein n=1 Tax=Salix viminalis TaxID=40686 RepID=A0A9Q0VIY7_SALVM|nr:hypothetical protein OIU85_000331 [Salix viminalis]